VRGDFLLDRQRGIEPKEALFGPVRSHLAQGIAEVAQTDLALFLDPRPVAAGVLVALPAQDQLANTLRIQRLGRLRELFKIRFGPILRFDGFFELYPFLVPLELPLADGLFRVLQGPTATIDLFPHRNGQVKVREFALIPLFTQVAQQAAQLLFGEIPLRAERRSSL
jgi:hypothetical protein